MDTAIHNSTSATATVAQKMGEGGRTRKIRVGEDVVGRSGQLTRPCWVDAGGVTGGVTGGVELVAWLVGEACLGSLVWSGVR